MKENFNINKPLLLSSTFITGIGNTIFVFALNWWIISETNDPTLLGMINAVIFIPRLIMNFFSGSLADSYNKKRILMYCDFFSGICCVALSTTIKNNQFNVNFIILINMLLAFLQTIYTPATRSIVSSLFKKDDILNVNSNITLISQLVKIVAPIIGGWLVAIDCIGISGVFFINGISFFITAIIDMFFVYKKSEKKKINLKEILIKSIEGLNIFREKENKTIFILMIFVCLLNFLLTGYELSLPIIAKKLESAFSNTYSIFISAGAVGCLIGAFSIKSKHKYNDLDIKNIILNIGLLFIPISLFALIQQPLLMICFIFVYSFFETRFNLMFFSYIQTTAKKEFLGRIISNIFLFSTMLMPLGNLIFGFMLDYNTVLSLMLVALFIAIISIVCFKLIKKEKTDILNS